MQVQRFFKCLDVLLISLFISYNHLVHMMTLNRFYSEIEAARRRLHYITIRTAVHLLSPLPTLDSLLLKEIGLLLQLPDQIIFL